MARAEAPGAGAGSIAAEASGRFAQTKAARKGRRHLHRVHEYLSAGGWLCRDFAAFLGWRGLRVLVSGGLQIATKFASVAVLYAFVDALTKGYPPSVAGWHLPHPDTAGFLIAGTVTAMGLLALSTLFRYDVRWRGIKLGRAYEEHCARRVVALASRLPDPRSPEANRIVLTEPMHLFVGYCKNCGMAARELTQLLPTFGSFLVGCVVLIVLDAWTTGALALMALLAFGAQYPANHRAAQASRNWERNRHESSRRLVDIFAYLRRAPVPIDAHSPVLDDLFATGPVRENMDSFANRMLGSEQASLVSRLGSHALLGGALLLLGSDIIAGTSTWARVAVYVTAVRFTLSDFVVVSKLATGITRFHAQIHRYVQFVCAAQPALAPRPAPAPGEDWALLLRLPPIRGDGPEHLAFGPGDAACLLMPWARGAPFGASVMAVASAASRAGLPAPVRLGTSLVNVQAPLRSSLGLAPEVGGVELESWLRRFADDGELPPALGEGWLDRPSEPGWNKELPAWAIAALHLIAARLRRLRVVAIDGNFADGMSDAWRAAWADCLAPAIRFTVREVTETGAVFESTVGQIGRHGETHLILSDDKGLVGWLPVGAEGAQVAEIRPFFRRVFQRRIIDRTEDDTDDTADADS
jgi:hypothetical protein